MNLGELKDKAINVGNSDNSMNGAYCSKDEKLFFVARGTMYVVPWSRSALQILEDEGFVRTKLKLDTYLIPHEKKIYWEKLCELFNDESLA